MEGLKNSEIKKLKIMKKEYMKPCTEVAEIEIHGTLLAGSSLSITDLEVDTGFADSRIDEIEGMEGLDGLNTLLDLLK